MKAKKILATISAIFLVILFVFLSSDYICACGPIDEFGLSFGIKPDEDGSRLTREKIISRIAKGSSIKLARNHITDDFYSSHCNEDFQHNIISCSFDTARNRLGFYKGYEIHFLLNDKNLIDDVRFNFYNWHLSKSGKGY